MSGKPTFDPKNPVFGQFSGMGETVREAVGIQFKGLQSMLDRTLQMNQAWTGFLQTQMNESSKLAQEYLKYGWSLSETIKNSAFELTDRATRTPSA